MCGESKFPNTFGGDQGLQISPDFGSPPGLALRDSAAEIDLGERLQVLDENGNNRFKVEDGDRVKLDGRFVDPKSAEVQAELKRLGITQLSEISNLRTVLNHRSIRLSDELAVRDKNEDGVLQEADGDTVEVDGKTVSSVSPDAKEALRKLHLKRQKDAERFGAIPFPPWPTDPQDDTEAVTSLRQIKNLAALQRYLDYMRTAEKLAQDPGASAAIAVSRNLTYARKAAAKAGVVYDSEWGSNISDMARTWKGFDSAVGIYRELPSELDPSGKKITPANQLFDGGLHVGFIDFSKVHSEVHFSLSSPTGYCHK